MGDFLFFDDIDNFDLEHDVFARQFRYVLGRECDVDVTFFALGGPNQLFFESGNKLATAQF